MPRVRRFLMALLALAAASIAVAIPAQQANAAGGPAVNKIIVWGDSMALAWPARYLQPLLGDSVVVEPHAVGSQDVQATFNAFKSWMNSATQAQINTTGHICWCGHVNNNKAHQGNANTDVRSIVPTLEAMRDYDPLGPETPMPPSLFMPIGLTNGPLFPIGSDVYRDVISNAAGTAVDQAMRAKFDSYAEVRGYLISDGLDLAGINPTQRDMDNKDNDVVPHSLRRDTVDPDTDAHLNEAGKNVTAQFINDRVRAIGWVTAPELFETSTDAVASENPVTVGSPVRITATVSGTSAPGSPSGYVQFLVDGKKFGPVMTLNAAGVAISAPRKGLTVGDHPASASYLGDANFAPSMTAFVLVVAAAGGGGGGGGGEQASTSTVIDSSMNPAPRTIRVHFSATVTNTSGQSGLPTPTGTVQFYLDGGAYGPAFDLNSSGVAATPSVTLPPGERQITAVYSGDANYLSSTSPVYTQTMT